MTTETKSTQPAVINPRNTGMKWQKLGEAKDPEFDKLLYLYDPAFESPYYCGHLIGKNINKGGVEYTFELEGYDDVGQAKTRNTVTHFAIPKPPVD